jgi:hypothetical protein
MIISIAPLLEIGAGRFVLLSDFIYPLRHGKSTATAPAADLAGGNPGEKPHKRSNKNLL